MLTVPARTHPQPLPAQMGVCVGDAWVLTCISLASESGILPRFSNGREITFPPFYLGAHLVQCGAAQLSCRRARSPLILYYYCTRQALYPLCSLLCLLMTNPDLSLLGSVGHRPSGWGPSTTWTLRSPPLTVMGHSVVTVVESWSQDLSFCYLAGIGAASWKNIVKDFDVAQQE